MSYESGAFGGAQNPESPVTNNQYGVRDTQDSAAISGGEIEGGGAARDYVVYFSGDEFDGTTEIDTGLTLPAGSVIVGAVLEIEDAITMGGTVDIEFGDKDSVTTDGVQFDDTSGVKGVYSPAIYNGSFSDTAGGPSAQPGGTPFTQDANISMMVSGGSAAGGKGKVVFTVRKV
jgi:hypothetical protein